MNPYQPRLFRIHGATIRGTKIGFAKAFRPPAERKKKRERESDCFQVTSGDENTWEYAGAIYRR